MLNAALAAGIDFLDTARTYAEERKSGRYIAGRCSEYYLATKHMTRTKEAMAQDVN